MIFGSHANADSMFCAKTRRHKFPLLRICFSRYSCGFITCNDAILEPGYIGVGVNVLLLQKVGDTSLKLDIARWRGRLCQYDEGRRMATPSKAGWRNLLTFPLQASCGAGKERMHRRESGENKWRERQTRWIVEYNTPVTNDSRTSYFGCLALWAMIWARKNR